MNLPTPKPQYDIHHQSQLQRQLETELMRLQASVSNASANAVTQAQTDARYVKLDGSTAMTGMLTLASVINALKLPNNARLVSVDTSSDQAGEFILVAGDNGTYVTLAPSGRFRVRDASENVRFDMDAAGLATLNGVAIATVTWSTSAPSGTPASGRGAIWVQY